MKTDAGTESYPGVTLVSPWKRRLKRALLLYVVTPYLTVTLVFAVGQRWLLYSAERVASLSAADVGAADGTLHDVTLHAAAGVKLHGWLMLPRGQTANGVEDFHSKRPQADRLLIYFPGNSGHRGRRVNDCRELAGLGFHVLLFDYRGYGDSGGSPSEELLAADARRAWLFAISQLRFSPEQIILFGESLGGAVASRLAAELSIATTPPAALILNSTFASLPETVGWHYPYFPFRFVLLDRYPTVERVPHVTCPTLMFHATQDDFVPLAHGKRLFAAVPKHSSSGIRKQFIEVPAAGHNEIPPRILREAVTGLMEEIQGKEVRRAKD